MHLHWLMNKEEEEEETIIPSEYQDLIRDRVIDGLMKLQQPAQDILM